MFNDKANVNANSPDNSNPNWGVDFLGYIVLPHYILPRTKTRRRIFKKLQEKIRDVQNGTILQASFHQTVASYLGFFKHANAYKLTQQVKNQVWFWSPQIGQS